MFTYDTTHYPSFAATSTSILLSTKKKKLAHRGINQGHMFLIIPRAQFSMKASKQLLVINLGHMFVIILREQFPLKAIVTHS